MSAAAGFTITDRSWAGRYQAHQIELISGLELSDDQKRSLRYRWLDEIDWLERSARSTLRAHQGLRVVAIIGGAVISGMVGYGVAGETTPTYRIITLILSLIVTTCIALDEFFRFGERWRHARLMVELMRSEGALFIALAGPYAGLSHAVAYPKFAAAVERLARQDVRQYVTQVVATGPKASDGDDRAKGDDERASDGSTGS
jgi:hypothetical protein